MSVLGGVASLGGSLISGLTGMRAADSSAQAARDTNAQNIQLAREQMAFQERMSSSAVQRSVADMRAAGMNPINAIANPASTPSGARPDLENPEAQSSAIRAMSGLKAGEGITNFTSLSNATAQTQSNVNLNSALEAKAAADVARTNAETATVLARLPVRELQGAGAKAIQPMVNSAVDAGRSASSRISDFVKSSGQSNASHWPFIDWKDTKGAGFISHILRTLNSRDNPSSSFPNVSPDMNEFSPEFVPNAFHPSNE